MYLDMHHGTWRVRRVVPPALVEKIRKRFLLRGTGTDDFDKAQRIARPIIKEHDRFIARAAGKPRSHRILSYHVPDHHTRSAEWYTPPLVFEAMGVVFDLDIASPGADVVPWIPALRHLTPADDGLAQPWEGFVFMNPPFGLRYGMQRWLDKFIAHGNGVALLPLYGYTRWWQGFTSRADMVLFVASRLDFIRNPPTKSHSAAFGSMLVGVGDKAVLALRTASANGLGHLFEPHAKKGKAPLPGAQDEESRCPW
jgi:hypothetical protein